MALSDSQTRANEDGTESSALMVALRRLRIAVLLLSGFHGYATQRQQTPQRHPPAGLAFLFIGCHDGCVSRL